MAKEKKAKPVKTSGKKTAVKTKAKVTKISKVAASKTKKVFKSAPAPAPIPSEEKLDIIKKFQVKEGDTGSPEVQMALLTKRIEKLVGHLKANPSDNHSRRGLLGLVSKRRRLLHYLEQKDKKRFRDIAQKLGLSK